MSTIKVDLLPGYGYSVSALYREVATVQEQKNVIVEWKNVLAAYRISVNGTAIFESRGVGAKKKWYHVQ